jgi:hypothetical protein
MVLVVDCVLAGGIEVNINVDAVSVAEYGRCSE